MGWGEEDYLSFRTLCQNIINDSQNQIVPDALTNRYGNEDVHEGLLTRDN
jgi:hypothetical protein